MKVKIEFISKRQKLLLHATSLAQGQYFWRSLVQIQRALDTLVPLKGHFTFHPTCD